MSSKYSKWILAALAIALPFKMLVNAFGASVKLSPGDFIVGGVGMLVVFGILERAVPRYVVYILGLVVSAFTSLIFASTVSYIAGVTEFVKLIGSVLWMIVVFVLLNEETESNLWAFCITSVGVSTVISTHSIIQRFVFTQPRPDSVFVNANLFAAYLTFNLAILTYIFLSNEKHTRKRLIIQLVIALVLILGILVSGSRSGLAGPLLYGIAFYFYTRNQIPRIYTTTTFVLAGIIGVGYVYVNPLLLERLMEPIVSGGKVGLGKRVDLWSSGINAWLDNPVTGMGYNQFELVFDSSIGLHNTYFTYLVETGILGLIMFLCVVLAPLLDAVRYSEYDIRISLFGVYIFFLLVHGVFHGVDNYRTLWVSIGIIAAIRVANQRVESHKTAS